MRSFIHRYWRQGDRHLLLLVTLVATLLLIPLIGSLLIERIMVGACFTLIFVAGVLANRNRPLVFKLAIALAAAAIVFEWGRVASDHVAWQMLGFVAGTVFFAFTAVMILIGVVRDRLGTTQAVYGAICGYLLLGLAWAHGYLLIEHVEPEAFHFGHERLESSMTDSDSTALSQMVYYSFVTMTTLGYGDITPLTPLSQTVTWMQAVTGQLFLAVLIARLVSELPGSRR